MSFYRLIIPLFALIFFQSNFFFAKADECKNFYDAVLKKDNIVFPEIKRKDLAIFFDYQWNKENSKVSIKRDKNNYPVVRVSLFEDKLLPGTIIKSIDGIDLSTTKDDDIINTITKSESSVIEYFAENEINKIAITSNKYNYIDFNLTSFYLNSINEIDTKEGFFSIDYAAHFRQKRNDLSEEGKFLTDTMCENYEKLAAKLFLPNKDVYLHSFEKDEDKTDSEEWFLSNKDGTYLDTSFYGLAKIRSKFNLKDYPFDTQNLKITWDNMHYTSTNLEAVVKPQVALINPKIGAFINLDDYKSNNFLKEWTVKDVKFISEFVKQKELSHENILINEQTDQLTIQITIQRNYNYYIYKVVIPVLLILIIAWSVLWIPPKQIESRLTTSIVSLLALIAYNFVFQDDIPKLNILTSLDQYVLLSYFFCAIPIFMTVFLSRFVATNQKRAYFFNRKMRLWGGLIYILFTLKIFFS